MPNTLASTASRSGPGTLATSYSCSSCTVMPVSSARCTWLSPARSRCVRSTSGRYPSTPRRLIQPEYRLYAQVLSQERECFRHSVRAVASLSQSVAFVTEHQQLALTAPAGQRGMDLLGLAQRHPGVVRTVDDEQRRGHPVDVSERRRLVQELPVMGERAVFALAERAPV